MVSFSDWMVSFRLRTLPLSLSSVILGSFLAAYHQSFNWGVCLLAVMTTLFLQILSNLANDYGDTVSGVDNAERIGPQRSLQSGAISLHQMKNAIIIFVILSLIAGTSLIAIAIQGLQFSSVMMFVIGIAAIIAAMKYTMGSHPYGYAGMGDIFVFTFFGLAGVMGTFFLHTHHLSIMEFLPAISIGCFSTGVLNLNNLRDYENDKAYGKKTMVVRLGFQNAKVYHLAILSLGIFTTVLYVLLSDATLLKWLFILPTLGVILNIKTVLQAQTPSSLDPELKKLSISTLLFALFLGIGLVI
ncbi:MAG: 1,4-dihydroxy-2-naphthoate polyprenyltransferase [Chitinophagales bacterium]|nr:1,4-dihydroxy-2-naphthoate polyprenyltransferase [Chitinophagales bacterium]